MTGLLESIAEFESRGGEFLVERDRIKVVFPPESRTALAPIIETLRANRGIVEEIVRERVSGIPAPSQCPRLPPGVRLVRYAPKTPPVAVAPVSIVTDVDMFIRANLRDLGHRLQHPKTYACAPLPEILAKLAEVGLELEILVAE